jgi:cytochrome c-type biogenesis protein CcmH/NrfG
MRNVMSLGLGLAMMVVTFFAATPANAQDTSARDVAKQLIARGLTVKAAEQMKVALAAGQRTSEDYATYGDAVRYSGDYRGAIQAYTYALQLTPMNTEALGGLALAYAQSGQTARGIEIVRTGLSQTMDAQGRRFLATTMASIQAMNAASKIATTTRIQG